MPPRSVRGFRPSVVREQRGWSLAQLGERIHVSRAQVWQWEDGRSVPTPGHLVALAGALEVDPYELFGADRADPSLHDLRVRRGLSAKDLAVESGLRYEALVHRLDLGRGPADVPDEVVRKLAEVLKVQGVRHGAGGVGDGECARASVLGSPGYRSAIRRIASPGR